MAENVAWVANETYPRARVALWAHDAHVMSAPYHGITSMGMHLRQIFGDQYYVVGFAFDSGTVAGNGVTVSVPATAPGSLESVLRGIRDPIFGVNLRAISPKTALGEYLGDPQPMRMLGAFYKPEQALDPANIEQVAVTRAFDSLIFVRTSTAAKAVVYQKALAIPTGTAGVTWPTKWLVGGSDPAGYTAGADGSTAAVPGGDIWLSSSTAGVGEVGTTGAKIPLGAYRGKRLRLQGLLNAANATNGAMFWMRVNDPHGVASLDTMSDRPLMGTTGWRPFSIVLDVPEDANDIAFGLILRGTGRVSVSRIALDVVDTSVATTGVKL
jgi:hypothetical protein